MASAVLETVIGLAFVFFLLALVTTAVTEAIANRVKKRAKYLLRGVKELLDSDNLNESSRTLVTRVRNLANQADAEKKLYAAALTSKNDGKRPNDVSTVNWTAHLMGHPLVRPFKDRATMGDVQRNPSYLPARAFAAALLDMVDTDNNDRTFRSISEAIGKLPDIVPFKDALLSLVNSSHKDLDTFVLSIERWYDDQMDRVSGSYKRWAKRWTIAVALVIAAIGGVDTVAVGSALWTDGPLRAAVVAAATNETLCEQGADFDATRECVTGALEELSIQSGLPLGWGSDQMPTDTVGWMGKVLGLVLAAWAASFGAPFWFDLLNKLGSMRNAGPKPDTAPAKTS